MSWIIGALITMTTILSEARQEPAPIDEREIPAYLEDVRRQMLDERRPLEDRAQLALEAAATLDRVAQARSTAEGRAEIWGRAIALLDEVVAAHRGAAFGPAMSLQAAVYRWASGRAWMAKWEPTPGDRAAEQAAADAFDDAIERLEPIVVDLGGARASVFGQNARYRLARVLADRIDLMPGDDEAARDLRERILQALVPLPTELGLAGPSALLRVRSQAATGRLDDAEEAMAAIPIEGLDAAERLDAQVALLVARRSFAEAVSAAESADGVEPAARQLRVVRVRALQWISLFPGRERSEYEADAFRRLAALRDAERPEARLAAVALARAILEPDARDNPRPFELLAEGHLALGDDLRAARLNLTGAEAADRLGLDETGWKLRYRAGAILFRRGDDARAEAVLTPVADAARDPERPAIDDQRAKASLLQVLCRGRQTSRGAAAAYEQALTAHIAAFPHDPTSMEVRFGLGRVRASQGRLDEALDLWRAIASGQPRWRESRLASVEALRATVENHRANAQPDQARATLLRARQAIDGFREEANDGESMAVLDLARAELELTPTLGDPEQAIVLCETVQRTDVDAARRDRARRLWVVALAQAGRYVDAEREAQLLLDASTPAQLLELVGRLDATAAADASSLVKRRLGYIGRQAAEHVLAREEGVASVELAEATLGLGRAQIATNDLDGARATLAGLVGDSLPQALVGSWADALATLGQFSEAADAYRLRVRQLTPGSRGWLETRYELALAEFRGGDPDVARRLVEGTEALHPELGGGDLREKFIRLKRRLDRSE